jgi:hypothetical protein
MVKIKKILNHPISIALIGLAILATIAWATSWQDYGVFSGDITDTDDVLIRDISATPPADGTIKRLPFSDLKTQIAQGADYWVGTAQAYLSNEIVVNDEATLYSALSDVNRFLEQNDEDPEFGVNDTTKGLVKTYGDNTTGGACWQLYNAANEDTNEEYWYICVNGDQIEIGPESDPDLFVFTNEGTQTPGDNPNITGYHLTTTENVWYLGMVDGDKSAGHGTVHFRGFSNNEDPADAGTTAWMSFVGSSDGATDEITINKPITTPSSDHGIKKETISASEDWTVTEPNTCEKRFVMSVSADADVEIELQTSGYCDSTLQTVRRFHLINNENGAGNYEFIFDPNGTDQIYVPGEGSCGAGNPAYLYDEWSYATLWGSTDTFWYLEGPDGNVSCSPQ